MLSSLTPYTQPHAQLKHSTRRPFRMTRSNPWCWDGVQCGVGDIQGLSLSGNQLQGVLPGAAMADLRGMVTLDLSNNEIGGRYWQKNPLSFLFDAIFTQISAQKQKRQPPRLYK